MHNASLFIKCYTSVSSSLTHNASPLIKCHNSYHQVKHIMHHHSSHRFSLLIKILMNFLDRVDFKVSQRLGFGFYRSNSSCETQNVSSVIKCHTSVYIKCHTSVYIKCHTSVSSSVTPLYHQVKHKVYLHLLSVTRTA